ncbi:MAG: ABC transporter ATP-binding protein [Candidatus Cybelea sp.]|jgi:putative ABC transport system ATP-binding protein
MLQLKGICKSYYTDELETRALLDINMTVERGEYISIEGPSGCGKSTLLSILGLLDSPSSGSYTLNGHSMVGLSINERAAVRNRAIGFIFQNFNLIGDLDVCSNVELPLIYRGVTPRERKRRVEEVLERVGLEHRARHSPAALSGGQQQRVAVARALAGYPSVLLADEPTGNLDTANGESVMEMLADLHAEGATVVMVTHDRRFARYADRTIGLLDGRLTDSLEPVELRL